jgi:uncharacterized protein YcbK (DUF882 family)
MKHFRPSEFECSCGECNQGFAQMDEDFLSRLDFARIYADIPFMLTSAYRCEEHNYNVGGVEDSAHTKGLAVDIVCESDYERCKIIAGALKAGITRIGIYSNFIHIDDDPDKTSHVIWIGKD